MTLRIQFVGSVQSTVVCGYAAKRPTRMKKAEMALGFTRKMLANYADIVFDRDVGAESSGKLLQTLQNVLGLGG